MVPRVGTVNGGQVTAMEGGGGGEEGRGGEGRGGGSGL